MEWHVQIKIKIDCVNEEDLVEGSKFKSIIIANDDVDELIEKATKRSESVIRHNINHIENSIQLKNASDFA